ncbi:IS630 family transposase [Streptomyces sp. AM6-12]|uniref:IS630 family transposase n=1 Tax=Streptomyces sp. AM6-12 TaxID=3345149 RepID=UPI003792B2DF
MGRGRGHRRRAAGPRDRVGRARGDPHPDHHARDPTGGARPRQPGPVVRERLDLPLPAQRAGNGEPHVLGRRRRLPQHRAEPGHHGPDQSHHARADGRPPRDVRRQRRMAVVGAAGPARPQGHDLRLLPRRAPRVRGRRLRRVELHRPRDVHRRRCHLDQAGADHRHAPARNNTAVAARLDTDRATVRRWRTRFLRCRLDGLSDEPRPGVPRTITDAQVEEVVVRTLEEVPEGATHWSKRELAKRVGISPTSVLRIWRAFGLQPWRTENFKISPDPLLIDKIRDVVGLYLAPPANAAVFAVDEKPQIQALERTAPVLPMAPGTPERRSFDYVRHGTVDLFAALNTATGKVIGKLSATHRAVDFRDFLDDIDRQSDPRLAVHEICDNLCAHKAPVVQKWLLAHPRFELHFTPTYSSWINQVERWFAELQRRCLERGVFCSLDELKTALDDWIKTWNEQARPFRWTKSADQIIDRICRYCDRISRPAH